MLGAFSASWGGILINGVIWGIIIGVMLRLTYEPFSARFIIIQSFLLSVCAILQFSYVGSEAIAQVMSAYLVLMGGAVEGLIIGSMVIICTKKHMVEKLISVTD